jgi:FkbM family methyltransferase
MRTDLLKSVIRASVPRSLRNWLRSPSKSAEWLWDASRFELGATEIVNFPRNWALICHPHAYRVFCQAQIADPDQRKEFENFLQHCDEKMFLLDIGAHFGVFSLAAAHFGGRAVAVDPSPTATRMIERVCGLNGLTPSVRTIRAAVSDEAGVVDMISSGVFSDGYFRIMRGRAKSELTRARAITIDELVDEYGKPTHIKIDVEGQEAAVLRGGRTTLGKLSPVLFVELHNEMVAAEGGDPDHTLEELSHLGYETFSPEGNPFPRAAILKHPIVRRVAIRASDG